MKKIKRLFRILLEVFIVIAIGILIWAKLDVQLFPKTANFLRATLGNKRTIRLEEFGYFLTNWADQTRYDISGQKAEKQSLIPVPPKKIKQPYQCQQVAGELDHTVDLAIIDLDQANLKLVCGTKDPAKGSGKIIKSDLPNTLLAFSGGFQYEHDHCGIVVDGKILRPMKKKAGTIVVYNDGRVRMGKWGRDYAKVTPKMKYVRQCLLLVDKSKFNAEVPFDLYAVDGKYRVFRSALGLTKDGRLIYAAGNQISAKGLANAMIGLGVVTAVHLDMNYENCTCGIVNQKKGKAQIQPLSVRFPSADRFLKTSRRDFFYLTSK